MCPVILPPPYRVDWLPADACGDADAFGDAHVTSFSTHYPVRLSDGCGLSLPLTPLPGGDKAVALLMSSQTSFRVERHIVQRMTHLVHAMAPEAVVGIPTLGLTYARAVAEAIGLPGYVALGHSRKFWYDDALSEAAVSVTSPDQTKRVYLDPALLARVHGRRVVVVDDVLNTGNTMASAIRLLQKAQANVIAIVAVLTEGWDWHGALARIDPAMPGLVHALGHIPIFGRTETGWAPLPETEADARPGA
jgi:adenine/guanine phosphoribosyltransferase-like PRPP-binding protein